MEVVMKRAVPVAFALMFALHVPATKAQSAPPRKDIPTIAKAAKGAIVTIVMANHDKPIAGGTGFLVSPDGVIVTNYHVIESGNVGIVKFSDGTVVPVDGVLAADKVRDLAIIKIHGKNFRTLTLGNSDRMEIGDDVVAIGNPLGLELTVSNGILSGVRTVKKEGGKFLQITAPISHGSSGGPLFNMSGEVIGITSMYFEGGENLNFAIPANDAKSLLLNQSATLQTLPNEHATALVPRTAPKAEPKSEPKTEPRETHRRTGELEDTLEWMHHSLKETANNVTANNEAAIFNSDGSVSDLTTLSMAEPNHGCYVSFEQAFSARTPGDIDRQYSFSFDLGSIDPASVSFKGSLFSAKTTNEQDAIDTATSTDKHSITFFLASDYGPRFTKAFKHAVTLCGGKRSNPAWSKF
jgi:hypothetical protein